jgi:hypothetical protein
MVIAPRDVRFRMPSGPRRRAMFLNLTDLTAFLDQAL